MNEETKVTMKLEEAITEILSLQLKHNQEIKQLQEDLRAIHKQIATSTDETNIKIKEGFDIVNNKLISHVTATNTQITTGLNDMKQEMSELMEEHTQKWHDETQTMKEQTSMTMASLLEQTQEINHNSTEIQTMRQNNERILQLENNQNVTSFSVPPEQVQQGRNISTPIINNDASSIHMNPSDLSNNRMQTILLSAPTNAPVFHGKPTERPSQFLIRVEEYTETVHMWGEDMLLRGISQFLKDTALEWYCQLRSCHYLPRTWTEFKQTFVKQFNSPIRIAQKKQQWKECKQNKDETINEFIVRLRALWGEQYPQETEADLIQHLFCKMRPDMLNIMSCPRNACLQEILSEAQRVEEILYYRTKENNQANKSYTNTTYNNENYFNKNHNETTNNRSQKRTQRNQTNQQSIACYHCGLSNHRSYDCWCKKEGNNNYSQQSTSYSKNDLGVSVRRDDETPYKKHSIQPVSIQNSSPSTLKHLIPSPFKETSEVYQLLCLSTLVHH